MLEVIDSQRMISEDTLPKLLKRNYMDYGNDGISMRKKAFGIWEQYTWSNYYTNVKYFCYGLLSLGLRSGDKVAIVGDGAPHWFWAELGVQVARGVPVGLFTDCVESEAKYVLENSESRFVVAKDQEQVDKMLTVKSDLPRLEKVIYWDPKGLWSYTDRDLVNFETVLDLGKEFEKSQPDLFEQLVTNGQADDIAFLAYTSGTGGVPKGAPLTHKNLISTGHTYFAVRQLTNRDEYVSSISPSWAPEQWQGLAVCLTAGMPVSFSEQADTYQADLREIAPEFMTSPSRGWEIMARQIQAMLSDAGPLHRFTYRLFYRVGLKMADKEYRGERPNLLWRILYQIGHLLLFRPLKDKFGMGRSKVIVTAGGFLNDVVFGFFRAIGVKLTQLYGATEIGIVAVHRHDDVKYHSVGMILPGVQVRITDIDEILVKGDTVFHGYHKDQELTNQRLVDGWLHTGDAGYFDESSHLVIMDRLDDLRELSGGFRYAPSYIESRLRFSPYIKDAVTFGDKTKPYVTAFVNIDFDNVARWAEKHGIPYTTFADLSQKPQINALIQTDIERTNEHLPAASRIRRFINLYKELDADEAELTRTKKLRRSYLESTYQNLVDLLYGEAGEVDIETEVKYRDGKVGTLKTAIKVISIGEEE
ncbi:MAG: long-chain fatty acid--CoA ligase [Planctomycetes bacterium]|nr:long-chain fatty acid--CoA ligase [Planctomycetota bacterium]